MTSRTQRRKAKKRLILAKNARLLKANAIFNAALRRDIVQSNLSSLRSSRFEDGRGLYKSSCADLKAKSHKVHVCRS